MLISVINNEYKVTEKDDFVVHSIVLLCFQQSLYGIFVPINWRTKIIQ